MNFHCLLLPPQLQPKDSIKQKQGVNNNLLKKKNFKYFIFIRNQLIDFKKLVANLKVCLSRKEIYGLHQKSNGIKLIL